MLSAWIKHQIVDINIQSSPWYQEQIGIKLGTKHIYQKLGTFP